MVFLRSSGLGLAFLVALWGCGSSSGGKDGPTKLGNSEGGHHLAADAEGVSDSGSMDLPSAPRGCLSFYAVTGGPFCAGRTWAGAGRTRCLENCEPNQPAVPGIMTGMFPCMAAYAGDADAWSRDVVCIPSGTCDIYCPDGIGSHD